MKMNGVKSIEDLDEPVHKILRSTSFSDPTIENSTKQSKMDALCELTSKIRTRPAHVEIPERDYEPDVILDYNSNAYLKSVHEVSGDKDFLTAAYIKKNMSQDMKLISKDIIMRSKQDVQKRPEFLSKQHQMKTSALRKQEEKDKQENNELFAKLKNRSQQIEQVEQEKAEYESQPEFMKVKLKPKQPSAVSS